MLRSFLSIFLFINFASCGHHNYQNSVDFERSLLETMVSKVTADLSQMGFAIDLSQITLVVQDEATMKATFNNIFDSSKREMKTTSLGPEVKLSKDFGDGASSRLAFYDPNSKTIIFSEGASTALTDGYLAHELTHVYQDQKWGLEQVWEPYQETPSRELFSITQFVIEGHAELVRQAYEQQHAKDALTGFSLSTTLGRISDNECLVCDFDQPTANLPYSLGMRFLLEQYEKGGWSSVERLFKDLPSSTEQIIHPKKFKADEPTILTLPDFGKGGDPELMLNSSLGEAFLLTKLLEMGLSNDKSFVGASGWEGDIAQLYRTKGGREGLVWRILFDRNVDAEQFEMLVNKKVGAGSISKNGRVIDMIISNDPTLKKQLKGFLKQNLYLPKTDLHDEKTTASQENSLTASASKEFPHRQSKVYIKPKY